MSRELIDMFGYCIIPKHTLLFQGYKEVKNDGRFFALKHYVAGAFGNNIEIWKTKVDISVIFLVEHLNFYGFATSSLPRLHNVLFPEEENKKYSDLDIKYRNKILLERLLNNLRLIHGINGWFTSLEDNHELEVCLFPKEKYSSWLSLIETTTSDNETYFRDSLKRIKIFPTKDFYTLTDEKVRINTPFYKTGKSPYWKYIRKFNADNREEAINEDHLKELNEEANNLRIKLKI